MKKGQSVTEVRNDSDETGVSSRILQAERQNAALRAGLTSAEIALASLEKCPDHLEESLKNADQTDLIILGQEQGEGLNGEFVTLVRDTTPNSFGPAKPNGKSPGKRTPMRPEPGPKPSATPGGEAPGQPGRREEANSEEARTMECTKCGGLIMDPDDDVGPRCLMCGRAPRAPTGETPRTPELPGRHNRTKYNLQHRRNVRKEAA